MFSCNDQHTLSQPYNLDLNLDTDSDVLAFAKLMQMFGHIKGLDHEY